MAPLGGLDRQLNLIAQWRKEVGGRNFAVFAGGATYFPVGAAGIPQYKDALLFQAETIAKAQKLFGVSVFSPAADDLVFGPEVLQKLAKTSGAAWVSANLVGADGKLLFAPFKEIQSEGMPHPVLVTGVSRKSPRYPKATLAPLAALRTALKGATKSPKLVVLISNLSEEETRALAQAVPEINVVLGRGAGGASHLEQQSRSLLFAEPISEGRGLLRLAFVSRGPRLDFYNSDAAYTQWRAKESLGMELSILGASLSAEKNGKKRRVLAAKQKKLRAELSDLEKLNFAELEQGYHYTYHFQNLPGVPYATPENEATQLMRDVRERGVAPTAKKH